MTITCTRCLTPQDSNQFSPRGKVCKTCKQVAAELTRKERELKKQLAELRKPLRKKPRRSPVREYWDALKVKVEAKMKARFGGGNEKATDTAAPPVKSKLGRTKA